MNRITDLRTRINVLYRALNSTFSNAGALAWFRAELERRGVDVPWSTFYRWVENDSIPENRREEVEEAIQAIRSDALEVKTEALQLVRSV